MLRLYFVDWICFRTYAAHVQKIAGEDEDDSIICNGIGLVNRSTRGELAFSFCFYLLFCLCGILRKWKEQVEKKLRYGFVVILDSCRLLILLTISYVQYAYWRRMGLFIRIRLEQQVVGLREINLQIILLFGVM